MKTERGAEARTPGKLENSGRDVHPAESQCKIRVSQWDYDKDERSGRDRFDLEFCIETTTDLRALFYQPRVPVANGQPRIALNSVIAANFTVITTGNRLDFSYHGKNWAADRAHCKIGQWSIANDVIPRRNVSWNFAC